MAIFVFNDIVCPIVFNLCSLCLIDIYVCQKIKSSNIPDKSGFDSGYVNTGLRGFKELSSRLLFAKHVRCAFG